MVNIEDFVLEIQQCFLLLVCLSLLRKLKKILKRYKGIHNPDIMYRMCNVYTDRQPGAIGDFRSLVLETKMQAIHSCNVESHTWSKVVVNTPLH